MIETIGYYFFYYVVLFLFWIALGASFWWSGRRNLTGRYPEDIPFRICQFTGPFVTVILIIISILLPPGVARGTLSVILAGVALIPTAMALLLVSTWRWLHRT